MVKTKISDALKNLKRVIVFEYDGKFIAFDPEVPSWVGLTSEEVGLLMRLEDGNSSVNSKALKLISKLLANYLLLDTKNTKKYDKEAIQIKPTIYYAKITNRCNLRCVYCYTFGGDNTKNGELRTDQWIEIINQIYENGGKELVFTGGEPLVRDDVFKIAQHAKDLGLYLSIITNGVLLRSKIDSVAKYFDYITVSVDSHLDAINSKTRGPGTLPKILEGIKMCLSQGIDVSINVVVTKYNMESIFDTVQFFEDMGIQKHRINLIAMIPVGRGEDKWGLCVPMKEFIEKTYQYSFEKGTLPDMKDHYFVKLKRKISCGALRTEILINEIGDVYPCRMMEYPNFKIGNMVQTKLDQILNSPKAKEFIYETVLYNIQYCSSCQFRYVCGGGCRANAFDLCGKIDTVDPYSCGIVKLVFPSFMFFEEFGINVDDIKK